MSFIFKCELNYTLNENTIVYKYNVFVIKQEMFVKHVCTKQPIKQKYEVSIMTLNFICNVKKLIVFHPFYFLFIKFDTILKQKINI